MGQEYSLLCGFRKPEPALESSYYWIVNDPGAICQYDMRPDQYCVVVIGLPLMAFGRLPVAVVGKLPEDPSPTVLCSPHDIETWDALVL